MPNINLLQDTTGEEPKPKEKKAPPPAYTTPPPEPKSDEPNPAKKLSPLGSFFGADRPLPPPPAKKPAKPLARPIKPEPRSSEKISTPPATGHRSWLGGVFNFAKPQTKITEERIENKAQPHNTPASQPHSRSGSFHGQKILEEKVVTKQSISKSADDQTAGSGRLGVNLMPDDMIGGLEPRKKIITYLIVLLISAGIIGGGYGALVWYENRIYDQADQTTQEVEQVNAKIGSLRADQQKAVLFKSQTGAIGNILDQHVYWTRFFAQLEKYTLPEVEYQSFAGSFTAGTNPIFSISAVTNSFDSVAKQILAFRGAVEAGDFISASLIDSGNRTVDKETGRETVQFTVQITTWEKIFYYRIGNQAGTNIK